MFLNFDFMPALFFNVAVFLVRNCGDGRLIAPGALSREASGENHLEVCSNNSGSKYASGGVVGGGTRTAREGAPPVAVAVHTAELQQLRPRSTTLG